MRMSEKYKDNKKYLWLLSTFLPLMSVTGVYLYKTTGIAAMTFVPLAFIYFIVPLLDLIFPEDKSNPPESAIAALEKNSYYRIVTYLMLPIHFFSLYYIIDFIVYNPTPLWMLIILLFTLGIFGGLAVNLGHEMGHKKSKLDKNLAKLALASSGYGHFNIEHNAGHHRDVATPEDSASSKYGENIYRFALREIPGGIKRAWNIEKRRLNNQGKGVLSWHNQILHSYFMTVCIFAFFTFTFGYFALVILLLHSPIVWWQLTTANYIEHYG